MSAPSPARVAALDRIARQANRFPDLDFVDASAPPTADGVRLEPRDLALARAIEHAVVQRWLTLAAVGRACVDRRWENVDERVQAAILAGAAQLLLFGNQADFAVVDDTVEWSKRKGRRGAAGFVNAVLRRVASLRGDIAENMPGMPGMFSGLAADRMPLPDGRVLQLTRPVFSQDLITRLSEQTSHGEELLLHWTNTAGRERCLARAAHGLTDAPTVIAGIGAAELAPGSPFAAHLRPHGQPGFFLWEGDHAGLVALLAAAPHARVQDAASAQPVQLTQGMRPRLILDACAGRGTKTRQLAQLHPDAEIVATDRDGHRLRALALAFEGHPRVKVTTPEGLRRVVGKVDLLALDVPCSNTGVLPRRAEAKYRFSRRRLDSVVQLQKSILEEYRLMMAPGASVLYSTCSLEAIENDRQAEWIARRLGGRVLRTDAREPQGFPGDPPTAYADGSYAALIGPG
ncbi:MAG: transcription antitermination factor NusB [Phycisphaerales bacterium]